jgi:hypothetical protein
MTNRATAVVEIPGAEHALFPVHPLESRLSFLHLVTRDEMGALREALARGHVPADFEAKLNRLAQGTLLHRAVARHCRTFIALLQAVHDGSYTQAPPGVCERLLRVLAYVRKDDDSIPDYKPDGFVDDQQEVRKADTEYRSLLEQFKSWRLRNQVPALWWS